MRTLALALAFALISTPVIGASHESPVPLAFSPVDVARAPRVAEGPAHRPVRPRDRGGDRASAAAHPTRPLVHIPPPHLIVEVRHTGGHPREHRGVASWFCGHGSACTRGYPGGLYAAAGPALRHGNWRGRVVVVEANGQSVHATLIDWCACPGGRLLDLYSDAFLRLAPLDRGLLRVTVTW